MRGDTTKRISGTPDIAIAVRELQDESLRLFLILAAAGYLAWHLAVTALSPPESGPHYWALFAIVVPGLVLTYQATEHLPRFAPIIFFGSGVLSTFAALWILKSPFPLLLFPILVLAAVALRDPLAGVLVGAGSAVLLGLLWQLGPLDFIGGQGLLRMSIASFITIVAAWALRRNMVIAVHWALASYDQATRTAGLAQNHRAELVQALKQLDQAYYRLERANAALELAWKAAEAAERSKSEFVANISHELRTPLNLIVGFSEMIVTSPETYGTPLPSAYRSDLNAVYRSAQHLLTLTDDVLDLARLGIGRMALAREVVDLAGVIQDTGGIVGDYLSAKGLWLRLDLEPDVPLLSIDRLRIRQVLLNLLTNAARFTDQGGITISAACDEGYVVVKVTDTGQGIAPADLSQVFNEFSHSAGSPPSHENSPLGREFGGIGLGLPISKRFIELHGGQMGVISTVDSGTTFWFTLPIITVDGATALGASPGLRKASTLGVGERLLILAEWDQHLARFLERHLRGVRVKVARNLREAIDQAREYRALAILADPATDPDGDHQECPVPIFHLPLPSGPRLAAALGAYAYLVKPVTRTELRTLIAQVIDQSGRAVQKVLVVDDDPRFVQLILRFLRTGEGSFDYQTLIAHNGTEALAIMEEALPDLVLLDLGMPGMGGEGVLAAMAQSPRLDRIPVAVVSAQEQTEEHLTLPGELTIRKPDGFQIEELLAVVEASLQTLEPPRRYLSKVDPLRPGPFYRAPPPTAKGVEQLDQL